MNNRRKFLLGLSLAGLGTATYSYLRGLRIPPFVWEPKAPKTRVSYKGILASLHGLIAVRNSATAGVQVQLRAYIPEPQIQLQVRAGSVLPIGVNNLSKQSKLEITGDSSVTINERINGISRILEIYSKSGGTVSLQWKLPSEQYENYKFAAIGDTGGAHELQWCLQRASELGAKFFLLLGDFNYQEGDYKNTIKLLNEAPIPCYVTIGNHDFHQSGPIFSTFIEQIGPLNYAFSIGKTRFVNIDTAARIFPSDGGDRGALFDQINSDPKDYTSSIGFTHRPLFDPDEERNHDIGSPSERDWLIQALLTNNIKTLLSGHIHIYARSTIEGIDNIIAGQGLGHQDLLTNSDYSKMAIGSVNNQGEVSMDTAPLSMPMALHCHPRSDVVKESLLDGPHAQLIDEINDECGNIGEPESKKPYPGY